MKMEIGKTYRIETDYQDEDQNLYHGLGVFLRKTGHTEMEFRLPDGKIAYFLPSEVSELTPALSKEAVFSKVAKEFYGLDDLSRLGTDTIKALEMVWDLSGEFHTK